MSWAVTQRDMEYWLGLTEVVMIRLPLSVWGSPDERAELATVAAADPLPDNWPELASGVARRSLGFRKWLGDLSHGRWVPEDDTTRRAVARIDFSLPWCARLRWGARNTNNVDVFIHATGGAGDIEWETI